MKRILFWVTALPLVPVVVLADTLQALGSSLGLLVRRYEGWCLDYAKAGWKLDPEGIWVHESRHPPR